ncbi:MAG: caspase family protein [Vicinamibacteria bacterium]|nr:caspase family protein [Vicinamibacteria bacterium]
MSARFHQLSTGEFAELAARFDFARRIDAVHLHHTWKPAHADYDGLRTVEAMWRHHTQTNGWSDIAQHVTIAPDGTIWTGRVWNQPPCSAAGHNGNRFAGPFMIELIGDFDGRDRLEDPQLDAALDVIARLQRRSGLPPHALRFHNEMSPKTCPGARLDKAAIVAAVASRHEALDTDGSRGVESPRPFGENVRAYHAALTDLQQRALPAQDDPASAELTEDRFASAVSRGAILAEFERAIDDASPDRRGGGSAEDIALTPERLEAMRPHLVNLTQGRFSDDGFKTSREDVDAIINQHLPRAFGQAEAAGRPLRVVFFAHGGLASERGGLQIAARQLDWWNANGVYPIHFVWETGLFEILTQLLTGVGGRAVARDVWDWTTDPAIELLARPGGLVAWAGMKRSAERSSDADGGARYLALNLTDFCKTRPGAVHLHAVGHSAGAIFHAHFLPMALEGGLPGFRSVHLLAPAVNIETFLDRLAPVVDAGVDHLTVYTMSRRHEEADHCFHVYRKSLLHLVSHALEPSLRTPILGLERSLRADSKLTRLFGLDGRPSSVAEVVWAPTSATSGRAASTSTTHGGFDDDAPTMNSVLRRVLAVDDSVPIVEFPAGTRAARDFWDQTPDPDRDAALAMLGRPPVAGNASGSTSVVVATEPVAVEPSRLGRMRAICVGVNTYPTAPLHGCVADARLWKATLEEIGFAVDLITDREATREAILDRLGALVGGARAGDVLVFQFSGHGTQVPDTSLDEPDLKDEALCPVDFASGRLIIDDDLAPIMQGLGTNVNLTCFIDCCHSGTISRLAFGAVPTSRGPDERPRFVEATADLVAAHRAFRAQSGTRRARPRPALREVLFAACQPWELAWESQGQGDFTRRAAPRLRAAAGHVTNESFQAEVAAAFGEEPRQRPLLTCSPSARRKTLLASMVVVA